MMRGAAAVLFTCAAIAVFPGCEAEEKVVGMNSMLSGLQGAKSQIPHSSVGGSPRSEALGDVRPTAQRESVETGAPVDPNANPLREVREDGSVILLSFAPRHLVAHLRQTLLNDEYDLLFDQLISERTKQEYIDQGKDPEEIRAWFQRNRRAVLEFLAKMPMGEQTPGLFMRNAGSGVYRLQLPNKAGVRYQRLDFVWERGVCRLVVIG